MPCPYNDPHCPCNDDFTQENPMATPTTPTENTSTPKLPTVTETTRDVLVRKLRDLASSLLADIDEDDGGIEKGVARVAVLADLMRTVGVLDGEQLGYHSREAPKEFAYTLPIGAAMDMAMIGLVRGIAEGKI